MSDFKRIRDNVQKMVDQSAPSEDIDGYLETEGFSSREFKLANENFGTFMSAVKRGGKNVGSLVADWAPIMGATALEKLAPDAWKPSIQSYKERQMKEAVATQEEIAKKLPAEYESYKEIEGVGDALGYAKEAIGESLASFLPGIVTGGVGSVLSRGAVAKAGQVAGEAARKGTLEAAKKAAERNVPGAAEEFVSGIAEQRAGAAGIEAAKRAMYRTELGRDVANTFIGSAAINIPDAYQSIYSETGQETLLPAFAAGSFNALLDSFTPVNVLRAAKGKGITGEAIMGAWYKRAAAGLGKGALTEGVTEGLQEITNAAAEAFVAEHDNIFTPENLTRFIDSAIRGAIAGGGVQAVTEGVMGKQAPPPVPPPPPSQPLQPPLGTPAPLPLGISGPAPVTPLQVESVPGEAGPGVQPVRDLAGPVPEGTLPQDREPIIDPETGRITGYREVYVPPGPPELEGEQGRLELPPQVGETGFLFEETPPQPTPAEPTEPPARAKEAEAPQPIKDLIPEIVVAAKKDPTASKILKGNNTASANAVVQKIESFMETPEADPVAAMEKLYQADRDGTYPAGVKPLTDAQRELLETTYKQLTGNDIEGVMQQRQFATAEQGELFAETPAPEAPQAPAKFASPEEAWAFHRNDDHPEFSDLTPPEQEAWKQYVAMNRGSASNFQEIVKAHAERTKTVSPPAVTPGVAPGAGPSITGIPGMREVPGITPGAQQNIANQIRGKQAIQVAEWIGQNGPVQFRELGKAIANRLKFFKSQGFEYRFTVLSPERGAAMLRGGTAGRHRFTSDPGVFKSSITLPPQTSTVETVLHELLHAATTPAILYIEQGYAKNTDLGKLIQELDDVAQFALKTLIDRVNSGVATPFEQAVFTGPMNSLGNIDRNRANIKREIISWSMTNPDMQMFMESIPYKGKNLFSAIVEAFRKFLGLSPRADTALYEVMRLTNEILNANYSDMQQAATEAGVPLPTPKAKKGEPKVGAEQVEYMVSTNTPAFRQWFRKSKIVNPDGTPKIMYHGTRYDIKRFKNKITFVSPSTWVANRFAANDMWWTEGKPVDEGANVIPLFVRAENPFDFENPKHVKQVAARVREFAREGGFDPYRNPGIKRKIADISSGSWTAIEEPLVWDAITDLGFDGAYLTEFGVKNLAVFDRNQLKSAIKSEFGPGEEIDLQTIAAPAGKFVGAPPPKQTTKLQPAPSTKQTVQNATNNAIKAFEGDWWTKWRVGWIDVGAGLSNRLRSLPVFDANGKLRADLLIRAASQTINLIKTGLQSGIPVLNADGTIVIQRDANNIGRSQQLADALDDNAVVKASGLSGRGFVAEIARALTGEEIINLDAKRRQEAKVKLGAARAQMQSALDQYKKGQISRTALERIASKVKAIRKRYQPDLKLDREKQVTPENIAWAKANLAAVPEVQEILNIWKNVNDSLLDLWVNTGLMTAETRDMFRRDRPNYVPLYAAREDLMAEEQEGYTGKAAGAKTVAEIERLEGSDKTRNLWENMDKHYAFMTAKAYNNHTRKMAVEQLMKFGIDSARITKAGDDRTNLRYRDYNNPDADASGIVHVIVDNPLDVAAFQTLPNQLGPIMKAMSASTQVLRATALINPMYWVKQLIRDPIHSSIAGQLDTIVTPFHAMKEYIQILANNSEEARILAERGVIGQIDPTISLQEYLKQVGTEKIKPSMVSEWSKKLMRMHEASDAATRVAIFKNEKAYALKELGMSEKDATNYAVHKARESINFAVRGNSPTLNALRHMIPFFSAAITSLDTLYRTATGYGLNAEEKAQVQRIFVKRAAMMVALSTAYAMLIQDDEDYQKLPDNVKDDNWLLPSPVGSEHTFIKIPIPFEIGFLFKTIPEGLVRYMSDTSTGKEVLASYRRGFMRSMPGEGVFIPQAVKPGLEAVFNYSLFTGRPIEGMSDQGLPVEARGPNASEVAKMMSKFGLSEIGLSPAKIDYLIRGYMAELGSFTTGVASTMMTELSGKEPPAKNLENQVFFRAFLTDPNTSKAATDFYDIMQNSQEAVNMMNRLKKEGRVEELEEFISDEDRKKLIAIAPSLRGIQDQMAKIRARINQIKADYDRDPEDRREEINKLQTVYDTVARRGYKVLEAAGIER